MNSTLRNMIYVFTASTFSKILGAIAALIIPNIMGPTHYGVWVTLLLIIAYAPIVTLGTVETLLKQYPYFVGKGEPNKAVQLEENVFGSICLTALALIICSILVPFILPYLGLDLYQQEIRLMLLAASINLFSGFFYFRFTAHHRFRASGAVDVIRAITTLLFVFIFVWTWGLKGAVIGYLLSEIVLCATSTLMSLKVCGKIKIRINLDFSMISQIIRIGFPITIVWWVLTLQSSVDRLVSASFLGKTMTGHYYLGVSFVSILVLIPAAVNRVLYPKITEGIGKKLDSIHMSSLVILPVRALSVTIPAFIGGLIIMLPMVYTYIFPKYLPGLRSAQFILLGFFFAGLIGNGANYLIAKNKQNTLLIFVLISLAANAVCAAYFISIGLSIEGVAISTGLATALLVTLIWKLVLKNMKFDTIDQWKGLLELYAPFILMLGLLFVLQIIFPMFLRSSSIFAIVYSLLFIVSYLAIALFIPPYNKWCKEIYCLFKNHIHGTL